mmetsp:Transcript_51758/g.152529  ORF Transcript_51758/g.152529 Transcript_51758/m.152529 type:complete len:100 (-) Transcript_51758:31-330(-)
MSLVASLAASHARRATIASAMNSLTRSLRVDSARHNSAQPRTPRPSSLDEGYSTEQTHNDVVDYVPVTQASRLVVHTPGVRWLPRLHRDHGDRGHFSQP